MKVFFGLIILMFSSMTWAQALDEDNIPPPPMPDYMIEAGYKPSEQKRKISSEPQTPPTEVLSEDDIKHEFLQAGEEKAESTEKESIQVQEVVEGDVLNPTETTLEQVELLVEDPGKKEPVEEVSEVEASNPEFEQAEINDPNQQQAQQQYLQDSDTENVPDEIENSNADKLAEVEETLEEAESLAEQTLERGRQPSNKNSFKAGMYKFSKDCTMHSEPRSASDTQGSIKAGRKLWVDPYSDGWHKAYKKSGTVYIPAECLQ